MKPWHMVVLVLCAGGVAATAEAQAPRSTSHYLCVLERSKLPVGTQYFYSGPVRNFSLMRGNESQLMKDAFQAEVYARWPSNQRPQDVICRSQGGAGSVETALVKEKESWARSGRSPMPDIIMTGWTHDFVAGSAGQQRGDPGPAVRLVGPGEAPRSSQPAAPAVDESAGSRAVAGAYQVQQQRDQARIDRERAEKAAYEKQLAATRAAEADYARRVAEFEAEKARYERDRAEWQARTAACKAGDSKACSGQARPM